MISFFRRHWRGDANFWLTLFAFTIVIPLFLYFNIIQWIVVYALQDTPRERMTQAALAGLIIAAIAVWQLKAMWRASSVEKAPQRWRITRWLARLTAVGVFGLGAAVCATIPSTLAKLYATATDADEFGQQGYEVSVDGEELTISGAFAWGLLDRVKEELAANPGVTTVVLTSNGGHVGVGTRLAELFSAHGLNTRAVDVCASSCTLAFLGGAERSLGTRQTRLGFHGVAGDGEQVVRVGEARAMEHLRKFGVTDDFIARALGTPASDVWWPTRKELAAAHVITE